MPAVAGRHLCLLLLAASLAACACSHGSDVADRPVSQVRSGEVEVKIASVGFDQSAQAHYVVLADRRHRQLPIVIGDSEAQSIMLEMHGIKPERPLTHDLLRSVIEKTGNRVDHVEIQDLHDDIYFAKIYLDRGRVSIDSRPSDAIALAMSTGAPIYVATKLFKMAPSEGLAIGPREPRTAEALGITVQELTPELATYFSAPASGGVLVAGVEDPARSAGVERGDIITRVGNQDVKGADDFSASLAKAISAGPVRVTLRRDGAERTMTVTR